MNGAHDLGGRMGFGRVTPEADEPVFHAPWEARMFAIALASGALDGWNLDEDRHACENRRPAEYLRLEYYQIWLEAFTKLLVEKGLASAAEIRDGRAAQPSPPSSRVLRPQAVLPSLLARGSYEREAQATSRFAIGDRARALNVHPKSHTRLARYLRGHVGEVIRVHGAHVFPDSNAHGKGEDPQWLYTLRFAARELWGREGRDLIHAEIWEPYLEPA